MHQIQCCRFKCAITHNLSNNSVLSQRQCDVNGKWRQSIQLKNGEYGDKVFNWYEFYGE